MSSLETLPSPSKRPVLIIHFRLAVKEPTLPSLSLSWPCFLVLSFSFLCFDLLSGSSRSLSRLFSSSLRSLLLSFSFFFLFFFFFFLSPEWAGTHREFGRTYGPRRGNKRSQQRNDPILAKRNWRGRNRVLNIIWFRVQGQELEYRDKDKGKRRKGEQRRKGERSKRREKEREKCWNP